jgi:excisionase family DNA binding protein
MDEPVTWLTIQEAADLLRVKVTWLYERTRVNEVPHVKLRKYLRFDRDELLVWVGTFRRDGRGHRGLHARGPSPASPRG